jgi:hypothetical protein
MINTDKTDNLKKHLKLSFIAREQGCLEDKIFIYYVRNTFEASCLLWLFIMDGFYIIKADIEKYHLTSIGGVKVVDSESPVNPNLIKEWNEYFARS